MRYANFDQVHTFQDSEIFMVKFWLTSFLSSDKFKLNERSGKTIVNFYSLTQSFVKAAYCCGYVRYKCPEQHFNCEYNEQQRRRSRWKLICVPALLSSGERWRRLKYNHIIILDGKIREYYELLQGFPLIYSNLHSITFPFVFGVEIYFFPPLSCLSTSSLFGLKVYFRNEIYSLHEISFIVYKSN